MEHNFYKNTFWHTKRHFRTRSDETASALFIFIGAADNIRRNIVDEVNHHGIIDTLSWVSQSVADWTVPDVRHPKPVDVALNYYGQLTPNHVVGNKNYGHSSNHVKTSYGNRKRQTKYKSRNSIKNKLTRSQRPPLTAKRKPIISNKRRKNLLHRSLSMPGELPFMYICNLKTVCWNYFIKFIYCEKAKKTVEKTFFERQIELWDFFQFFKDSSLLL